MYDLILAPPASGKSFLAEKGEVYDYDRIIAATVGWPTSAHILAKMHAGRWWREKRALHLIHAAHVGALVKWMAGPDRPYLDPAYAKLEYVTERALPILGMMSIDTLADDPRASAWLMARKVAVWLPGYDLTGQSTAGLLELLRERLAKRTRPTADVEMSDVEASVMHLIAGAAKHHLQILVNISDPTKEGAPSDGPVTPDPAQGVPAPEEAKKQTVDERAAAQPTILPAADKEKEMRRGEDATQDALKQFFGS